MVSEKNNVLDPVVTADPLNILKILIDWAIIQTVFVRSYFIGECHGNQKCTNLFHDITSMNSYTGKIVPWMLMEVLIWR